MSRIVIVGIDGMDWPLVKTLMPELPTIREIRDQGFAGEMTSIFPPDSIPSWISIFTGLDPSEHGVLETIDYFKKDFDQFAIDTSSFRGRTFWDLAGNLGKEVIVVNPLLAYPPWDINGVMASGPVFISGETSIYPEYLSKEYDLPPLGGIVDFPEKGGLAAFAEKTLNETERILDLTLALMESKPWDLVFVSFLTMDRIFHFFWRYFDTEDPTHPRNNKHAGVIMDFHRLLDKCIRRLRTTAGDDAIIMIISDHGHNRRPTLFFNLNQLLLDNGFLKSRVTGPRILSPRCIVDRAKNFTLEVLHRLDMEDLAYRLAHIFPWTRSLKRSDFLTEPASNLATASDFGGNNPFGGVDISKERCAAEGLDYEEIRDRIIALLLETRDKNDVPVFIWAKRREEVYNGPFIGKFPDVLYEMRPVYGTNWSLHLPLVTTNPRHRKISGGHRMNSVLITGPLDNWSIRPEEISPLNISATSINVITDGGFQDLGTSIAEKIKGRPFIVRSTSS